METLDLAIAVFAVLAVGGSVLGVMTYQGGNLSTYVVTFEKHQVEEPITDSETLSGQASHEFTLDVTQHNITDANVTVDVSTDDAVLTSRDVEVEVEPPDFETKSGQGSIPQSVDGGSTTVEVRYESVTDLPESHQEQASSPSNLRQQATEDHSHTKGVGNWTVTVTISGGQSGDPAMFDVTVEIGLTYFDVHAQKKTPSVQR